MMKFLDSLVGPLQQNYCYYFYVLALIFLVTFIAAALGCVSLLFQNKRASLQTMSNCLLLTIQPLIAYLVSRLMYIMCRNSIN